MADNVNMRDYNGVSKVMRTTDTGTAHVPHHIVNDVAIVPTVTNALNSYLLLAAGASSLYECDVHFVVQAYFWIIDAAALPADGAVTPKVVPKLVGAGSWLNYSPKKPIKFTNGILLACSSTIIAGSAWQFTHLAQGLFSGIVGLPNGEAS